MAAEAQILTILNILVALHLSRVLYKFTLFMQNKPNSCRGVALAKTGLSPSSARRYKNFTRHSVSEGGPIQTQFKPNSKPILTSQPPPKAKTNPNKPNLCWSSHPKPPAELRNSARQKTHFPRHKCAQNLPLCDNPKIKLKHRNEWRRGDSNPLTEIDNHL